MIYNTHIVSNELWLKCNFILINFIYETLFLLKSMKKVQSMNYHWWLEKPMVTFLFYQLYIRWSDEREVFQILKTKMLLKFLKEIHSLSIIT
jgi:hypothetical protein